MSRKAAAVTVGAALLGATLFAAPSFPPLARAFVQTDLDAFMKQVLAKRDDNWKKLQQYILEEGERIEVRGPSQAPVWGERRDYNWFIKDGYFVRSPVSVNGVSISEAERRKAEDQYLKEAKSRDKRRDVTPGAGPAQGGDGSDAGAAPTDVGGLLSQRRAPEFVESAYFLRFRFEEGKYAFVGREKLNGHDVLRIEYYPAHLFGHEQAKQENKKKNNEQTRDQDLDAQIERMMNKVSLVTIWVEPKAHQIVKYTFDNVNFDFLPAAWLVRVSDAKASMTMSQAFPGKDDVWLPKDVDMFFGAVVAIGSFDVRYHLDFHDYKEATTAAHIKIGRGSTRSIGRGDRP